MAQVDDNHAPLVSTFLKASSISRKFITCQALGRFFTLLWIKPNAPPFVGPYQFFKNSLTSDS